MSAGSAWLDGDAVPSTTTWEPQLPPLIAGSAAARLLYAIWADEPVDVTVDGTERRLDAATALATHLAVRSPARVTLCVANGFDRARLVRRLAEHLPPDRIGCPAMNANVPAPRGIGPVPDRPTEGVQVLSARTGATLYPGEIHSRRPGEAFALIVAAGMSKPTSRIIHLASSNTGSWDLRLGLGEVPFDVVVAGAPTG